jgi:dethiobiotin synthetase
MGEKLRKGVFIIGTDTGVGKTVVGAGLALCLKEQGIKVGVMKPVATGCLSSNEHLFSQDAIYLFEAAENEYPLLSNPIRFKNPLAPHVASQIERKAVDLKKIFWAYDEIRTIYDFIIVEGIGGLLVPFTNNYFVADLVKEFNLPVLVVARAGLGTINHTLLTVQAAKNKGLNVRGIILNGMPEANFSLAEITNPRILQDLTGLPVLGVLPKLQDVDVERLLFGSLKKVFAEKIPVDTILGWD